MRIFSDGTIAAVPEKWMPPVRDYVVFQGSVWRVRFMLSVMVAEEPHTYREEIHLIGGGHSVREIEGVKLLWDRRTYTFCVETIPASADKFCSFSKGIIRYRGPDVDEAGCALVHYYGRVVDVSRFPKWMHPFFRPR